VSWDVVTFDKRSEESLPVARVARKFGVVQSIRNKFMNKENGYVGAMLLRHYERSRCGMEKLVA
jgi:hypothetical protein